MGEKIEWRISVPIFRNTLILKQLGFAIGIPFGLLVVIFVFISGKSIYTIYALGLIGTLLFSTWLFVTVVYRGKYEAEFILDGKGVHCSTQASQAKKNRIVNTLTVVLGLLSGKPAVAGAGMMAGARQNVYLSWDKITKIKYQARCHSILLRGGWSESIGLFCTKENYNHVEQFVRFNIKK